MLHLDEKKAALLAVVRGRHLRWLLVPFAVAATVLYGHVLHRSYPVGDWLFWPFAYLWSASTLFSLAAVASGFLILSKILPTNGMPTLETLVLSFAIGLVCFALGMYLGGALGWYRPWFSIALPTVLIGAGSVPLARFCRERFAFSREGFSSGRGGFGPFAVATAACGFTLTVFVYLQVMTPESINYDAAWYHLPTAQDYARAGRIIPFFSDYNRAFPHLASLVYTWGFLLPGLSAPLRWMMALHLEFTCFLWTLAGVAAAARWMLAQAEVPSTWVAFFLYPAIFVYDQNLGGAADHVLALFAAPIFLATVRVLPTFALRQFCVLGIVLGGAVLTKYQAVYFIGGNGVLLAGAWLCHLWRVRKKKSAAPPLAKDDGSAGASPTSTVGTVSARLLVLGPAVLVGTILLVTAPHFVKNLIFYKNPFFPLLQRVFDESYPQHPKALLYISTIWTDRPFEHHTSFLRTVWASLRLTFTCSFVPHYSFTRDVPVMGSLFWFLMPFALFVRGAGRIGLGIGAAYVATFVWAYTYFVDRYLQAIVPLYAAVTAALLVRAWQLGAVGRVALLPLVVLQLVWSGDALFYSGAHRIEAAMGLISSGFERRAEDRFDKFGSSFVRASNSVPENARVLWHAERKSLGFDHDLIFDIPNQQGLVYYDHIRGSRDLYDYYRSLGVTHLAWLQPALYDHTMQGKVLFATFITNYAQGRRSFDGLHIARMPDAPPPAEEDDFDVLVLGTAFENGVYKLEQLAAHEGVAMVSRKKLPAPTARIDDPTSGVQSLAEAVDAVVVRRRFKPRPALKSFIRAMRYDELDVFVRRAAPNR